MQREEAREQGLQMPMPQMPFSSGLAPFGPIRRAPAASASLPNADERVCACRSCCVRCRSTTGTASSCAACWRRCRRTTERARETLTRYPRASSQPDHSKQQQQQQQQQRSSTAATRRRRRRTAAALRTARRRAESTSCAWCACPTTRRERRCARCRASTRQLSDTTERAHTPTAAAAAHSLLTLSAAALLCRCVCVLACAATTRSASTSGCSATRRAWRSVFSQYSWSAILPSILPSVVLMLLPTSAVRRWCVCWYLCAPGNGVRIL